MREQIRRRVVVKEWLMRLGLTAVSLLVALAVAEAAVRVFYPIYDGRDNVTLEGERIREWFKPGSVYRQVSNEYNAVTTITPHGHRVPGGGGNPDVVFLGDSFTFGWGLDDQDTFASLYCQARGRRCANLGLPGSGTAKQVERLKLFLDKWAWRPKEVKLFFFGMSTSFSSGNDFVDNYNYEQRLKARAGGNALESDQAPLGLVERAVGWQEVILERSNLMRVAKYHWGPLMKSVFLADPGEERMTEALAATKRRLRELDELSRQVGFDYSIYLLVPVQDVIRKSYPDTLAALDSVSPKPAISTAQLFLESPQAFYFAYDGHLNAKGSRRIAEFVAALETAAQTPTVESSHP